jgi:hypothetical protein
MIVLHRHRLIFLKTRKTAGTSIEIYLGRFRDATDIVTPIYPPVEGHRGQNYKGSFNPFRDSRVQDAQDNRARTFLSIIRSRQRYFNHMTAADAMRRLPSEVWNGYLKVAVERNPWDKVVSMYHMLNSSGGRITLDEVIDRALPLNWPAYADPVTEQILVDKVLRYETLSQDLADVFASVGIPFDGDLGIAAKSEPGHTRRPVRFTPQQLGRIERRFAKEIAFMGYKFADSRAASSRQHAESP